MNSTICAFSHQRWEQRGLACFTDFADQISEVNAGEDALGGFGEWFFVPEEPLPTGERVIYFGSWSSDHCAGASMYTHAEIFDVADPQDAAKFAERVSDWESLPEWTEQDD